MARQGGAVMAGQGGAAAEEIVVDDLFDNIDDLLDFPDDAGGGAGALDGWGRGSDLLCCGALLPAASGSCLSGPDSAADDDLGAGLSVPTEDIPELDWLSSFVEDSFSAGSFGLEAAVEEDRGRCHKDGPFQTSSPISVLDSTSSTSSRKLAAPLLVPHLVIPSRARSKLPRRPATFRFRKPLVSPASSTDETDPHSSMRARFLSCSNFSLEFESIVELRQRKKMAKKTKKTKKKQKLFVAAAAASDEVAQPVRKCSHCEIQKTPQWRAGPMGPKTLCNACGVRYKSGRLFPEYRPAASPTFVPALHSNSHKKVLEMRDEMGQKDPAPVPRFVRKTSHCDGNANGTKKSSLIHEVK